MTKNICMVLVFMMIGFVGSAAAQNTPADNMEIVKEKIRTDKKLFIATNMQLTEQEAKTFWPIYDAYQSELETLVNRKGKLIEKFAANYESMSDETAKSLLDNNLSIDSDYQKLRQSYL